jgi:uncharacterized protein YodC (DUF2158 family)
MGAVRMRVGDVVRLRSGGPDMTVECLRGAGLVECVWFNEGRREGGQFLTQTLEMVTKARPEPRGRGDAEAEGEDGRARLLRKPRKGVH